MIKYTTSDIIKRAEQLADLENSDFISDFEKLALLNESWQMVYQKVINANDRTWIKTVKVCNGMILPKDLFQIASLFIEKNNEPVPKRNSSQRYGYEITNNRIFLSEDYRSANVVMEYYPVPKTLFLRDKTIDCPFDNDIIAANHSLYIDSTNTIHDLNDSSVDFTIGDSYYDYALFDNAAWACVGQDLNEWVAWDYDGIVCSWEENPSIPMIIDNTFYRFYQNAIYDTKTNKYLDFVLDLPSDVKYIYANKDLTEIYKFAYDGYYYNDNEKVMLADRYIKLQWRDNKLYAILRGVNKLVQCTPKEIVIMDTEYIPKTFVSEKYVMATKKLSRITYLEGFIPESVLDFSNNLYFIVLAYMLAITFKNKQGSDTAALSAQYESAVNQLFESINRDASSNYQIKNVYSVKGGPGLW